MWISKKKQKIIESELCNIKQERDEWKAKYLAITEGKVTCINEDIIAPRFLFDSWAEENCKAMTELKRIIPELEMWKQRYADEVQKRLALIEQMKG